MRRQNFVSSVWIFAIAVLLTPLWSSLASAQNRIALVLGNSHYENLARELSDRAVIDAGSVAEALLAAGFHVRRGTNLGRRALFEKLAEFSEAIRPGDIALVFYAGHGVSIGDLNYLVPVDVPAELADDRPRNALVSVDHMIADLHARRPRVLVLVLDALRGNPFRDNRLGIGGLTHPQPTSRTFTVYSAAIGHVTLDRLGPSDPDRNSLFARVLIQHIGKPELPLTGMMQRVAESVASLARSAKDDLDRPSPHEQTPTLYNRTDGVLIHLAGRPGPPATALSAVDALIRTYPTSSLSPPDASAPPKRVETVRILPPPRAATARPSDQPVTRGPGEAYVVQIASQRSEEDARAAFEELQAKYPAVLGGRQVLIQRAELGGRGVYYRAQVGPFPTVEEATELCGSLKQAGGQCIVQRY